MDLEEMRNDCSVKQKKGIHFIIASVIVWLLVLMIHVSDANILTKNLLTFFCTAPLLPISYVISKVLKIDFQNKSNPLTNLGILFSVNQMAYLLIAMWIYQAVPSKMLMVIAIIFGAHLMPYGWLYKSNSYLVLSVIIPVTALVVGLIYEPWILASIMMIIEIIFSISLALENRKIINKSINDKS